jgi:hypothetical protein
MESSESALESAAFDVAIGNQLDPLLAKMADAFYEDLVCSGYFCV